jgi:simple sugar transport system substrate-binding protein
MLLEFDPGKLVTLCPALVITRRLVKEADLERVEAEMAALASGTFHPFAGPLNRQDGSVWKAEGEIPTDEELYGMDFYVEGIEGSLPT